MALRVVLAAASAAMAVSPGVAGAVTVAPGPDGRALLTWSTGAGLQVAERTAAGTITPAQTIAPGAEVFDFVNAWSPAGEAIVVAYDQSAESVEGARKIVVLRRAAGASTFGAPATIARAGIIQPVAAASSSRGDIAVLLRLDETRTVLLTAARGGPFGPPQEVDAEVEFVALGVGGSGRVVLACFDRHGTFALHSGQAGSALGPAQRLGAAHFVEHLAVAVDDAGNATVVGAGSQRVKAADRRAQGEFRSVLVVARARPGAPFGSPATIARGTPHSVPVSVRLAAAGTTTALAWKSIGNATTADGRFHVAIAHGAGRFAPAQRPSVAPIDRFGSGLLEPSLAVDAAGDVLFAYDNGFAGHAVHVTRRRAGSSRFGAPRVISTLGRGGQPVATLLSDRTPFVAWHQTTNGALRTTSSLAGRRPDLTPPRARIALSPGAVAQLKARNTLRVRIFCSEPCIVQARAQLRTKTGRVFDSTEVTLRGGESAVKRFSFDPAKQAGRARAGSKVRVTVDAENSSGVSSETVKQITLR